VSHAYPLRVLVVGDPYMPAGVFASALAGLGDAITVTELQLGNLDAPPPRTLPGSWPVSFPSIC